MCSPKGKISERVGRCKIGFWTRGSSQEIPGLAASLINTLTRVLQIPSRLRVIYYVYIYWPSQRGAAKCRYIVIYKGWPGACHEHLQKGRHRRTGPKNTLKIVLRRGPAPTLT